MTDFQERLKPFLGDREEKILKLKLWFDRPVKKTSLRFGVFVLGSSFLGLRSLVFVL